MARMPLHPTPGHSLWSARSEPVCSPPMLARTCTIQPNGRRPGANFFGHLAAARMTPLGCVRRDGPKRTGAQSEPCDGDIISGQASVPSACRWHFDYALACDFNRQVGKLSRSFDSDRGGVAHAGAELFICEGRMWHPQWLPRLPL